MTRPAPIVITLTPEQVQAIAGLHDKHVAQAEAKAAKAYAALKRRTEARVEAANQRTTEWKQIYQTARKALLSAHAEITTLKRRIRKGDWNE